MSIVVHIPLTTRIRARLILLSSRQGYGGKGFLTCERMSEPRLKLPQVVFITGLLIATDHRNVDKVLLLPRLPVIASRSRGTLHRIAFVRGAMLLAFHGRSSFYFL
jgi:hypothetical protein